MTLTFLENADVITVALDSYEYGIENSGATAVTLVSGGGGTAVVIPQSATSFVAAANGEFIKLTQLSDSVIYVFNRRFIQKVASTTGGKARLVTGKGDFSFTANETYSAVKATLAAVPSGGSGTFTTLSGDVVSQSTGGATIIQPNVVTNAKSAQMAAHTFKGNNTGSTANPIDLTISQVKTDLALDNVDNTTDANKPISSATQTALNAKQATLVSGTNIKTINGTTLLGSGDLVISGGGGLTEYGVAVTGGSGGITARLYGTSLITVTREATDTYRFNIPASGYAQSWELNLPIADNTVAGYTLKFVYASPTFNTNFATMKPSVIQMMTDTGNVYVSRAAPAATDFATTNTIPTSGTLQQVVTVPSAIQGVVLKIVGKF